MQIEGHIVPYGPRVTVDEFFTHFDESSHDILKAMLIDQGRLLAWTGQGPIGMGLPLLCTAQPASKNPVDSSLIDNQRRKNPKGYTSVAFFCQRDEPVTPLELWGSFGDGRGDFMGFIMPNAEETFDEWHERLDDEGESLEAYGDTLFLFLIRELGSPEWVSNDRRECIRLVKAAISDLNVVLRELESKLE